jgi:hypothetical protein
MASIQIRVPDWLDRICAWPMMMYRRWKYGYPYRRIYLGEGEWTILDSRDYYQNRDLRWNVLGTGGNLYAVRNKKTGPCKTKMVYLHREMMNPPDGLLVDHRNCDGLDNRRENLRLATHAENMLNRRKRKNTSSKYIGVSFYKRNGKWDSRIYHRGKVILLGRFDNEIEAAKTYDAAAKKYHGEFARLNFTEEI